MAVGLRDARAVAGGRAVVGAAAAVDWVLKDALGKVTRLCWAGRMGRSFDGDAKRWRFRSSLLRAGRADTSPTTRGGAAAATWLVF